MQDNLDQIAWMLKIGGLIDFTNGEMFYSVADVLAVGGTTISLAFSEMRELEES